MVEDVVYEVGKRINHKEYGEGTIVEYANFGCILVRFDKIEDFFHSGNGVSADDDCYWVGADDFIPLEGKACAGMSIPIEQKQAQVLPNAHYQTDIQPIEFMQANMSPEAFQGGLRCNIIKYTARLGKKDDELKEALKIADYSRWLVLAIQGKKIDPRKD